MLKEALKQFSINKRFNLPIILLLIIGTISWSLTMIKSGLIYSFGMGFWGANGHDGVWHIALANSLARNSFQMPVLSGFDIKNYHLSFDLLLGFASKITSIPVHNLYFQVIPPILALLVGFTCYLFVYEWTKSTKASLWATFFVYFGGDAGWIIGKGESTFWSQQSISTLINPPFALSLVFIFLGLFLLLKLLRKFNLIYFILAIIFFGVLLETKAYAGVLVLGSLFLAGTWEALRERKYEILKVFLGASFLTLILFLFLNKGSENLFIFQPFWFLQTLFNLDRFSIPRLASAIANYNLAHNWPKLFPAYILAFILFWVGNMWTRLLKEIEVIKWLKKPGEITPINLFVTAVIISGAAIPMLFLQKGTPWNTIQFFYYSLIFGGILAGVAIKNLKNKIAIVFIILLTIPTTIFTLKDVYIPDRPPAKISIEELSALSFLQKEPDGVVLTYPFDSKKAQDAINNPPRPLYLYDSTAYVSAFSNHQTFLEDEVNLNITNFNWRERRSDVFDKLLNTLDQTTARNFLKENKIKYIYWIKDQRARLGETQLGIKNIFENKEVKIYKVEF